MEIGQTSSDVVVSACDLYFKPSQGNQTKELEIIAERDFTEDGDQSLDIVIKVPINLNLIDWMYHRNITNIKVGKNLY